MAEVRPFRGVRYNQSLVKDLAAAICPPYDVISPKQQQELYEVSDYNFVRLEYAHELPGDTADDNKFTRSAATLEQWLKQGILKTDDVPAIYLHDHLFVCGGQEYRRRGITVRVRLEEWSKMVVRPHEGTLSRPKDERLNLLWACQANISPVLALFEDRGKQIARLLDTQARCSPVFSINTSGGESHRVWAITDEETIRGISSSLADQPLYVADGHHRYESALTYRRQRLACSGAASGDEPFNFVMMTLVDSSDPGLVILPVHRLIRGIPGSAFDGLKEGLSSFFEMEELPVSKSEPARQVDELLRKTNDSDVQVAIYGLIGEHLLMLKLRDADTVSKMVPCFHSDLYSRLDVSVVDHVILDKLLGWDGGRVEESPAYSHDTGQAMDRVSSREFQLAILLKPVKAETIKAVADAGDRMPRKSTYFHPKVPSGLVFYRLVQ